ncbi:hypothetical protein Tco_0863909 [Tanacetum coccineum]
MNCRTSLAIEILPLSLIYHALMEALIEDGKCNGQGEASDQGPSAGSNEGVQVTKRRRQRFRQNRKKEALQKLTLKVIKEGKLPLTISKLKAALVIPRLWTWKKLVPYFMVESEAQYDISCGYGITHQGGLEERNFKHHKHSEPSDREAVRTQCEFLSVELQLFRVLFEYNKGMETRKWSEDDKRRSKDFITAIEKRLQIRRIFRSLESFVRGRIRDIDYRLINRTT